MRLLTPVALALLLLSVAGLVSSSSGADDALFARAQGELETLWSGMLGCADGHKHFTPRNRLDDSDNLDGTGGGVVATESDADYSECGRRALRVASSQILLDNIEDSLRQAGLVDWRNKHLPQQACVVASLSRTRTLVGEKILQRKGYYGAISSCHKNI